MVALGSKQELRAQHNSDLEEVFELYLFMGYTMREAADELGVKYSTLKTWAWEAGVTLHKDNSRERYRPTILEYKGKEYNLTELAKAHGMTRETLKNRLANDWDLEKALTIPVTQGNYKPRIGRDREPTGTDIQSLWLRGKL